MPDQVVRHLGQPLVLPFGPAIFDRDVPAFGVAGFAQPLVERRRQPAPSLSCRSSQQSNHRHRLRTRNDRPRQRSASTKPYEVAPLHIGPRFLKGILAAERGMLKDSTSFALIAPRREAADWRLQ